MQSEYIFAVAIDNPSLAMALAVLLRVMASHYDDGYTNVEAEGGSVRAILHREGGEAQALEHLQRITQEAHLSLDWQRVKTESNKERT